MTNLDFFKKNYKTTEYTLMDKVNIFKYKPSFGVEIEFAYSANIDEEKEYLTSRGLKEVNAMFSNAIKQELFNVNLIDFENDLTVYTDGLDLMIESEKEQFLIRLNIGETKKVISDKNQIKFFKKKSGATSHKSHRYKLNSIN